MSEPAVAGLAATMTTHETQLRLVDNLVMVFQLRGGLVEEFTSLQGPRTQGFPNLARRGPWLAPADVIGRAHGRAVMRQGLHSIYSAKDGHWQVDGSGASWPSSSDVAITVMLDFAIDPLGRSATGTRVRDASQPLVTHWKDHPGKDVFKLEYVPPALDPQGSFRLTVRDARGCDHVVALPVPPFLLPDVVAPLTEAMEDQVRTYHPHRLMFAVSGDRLTLWFQSGDPANVLEASTSTLLPADFVLATSNEAMRLGAVGSTRSLHVAHNVEFLALHAWSTALIDLPRTPVLEHPSH